MSDEMDYAQQREQNDREIAIKYNRRPQIPATGFCYNCGEVCHGCFCDGDCRDDWTKRKNFNVGIE